jgi:hypothetical protein
MSAADSLELDYWERERRKTIAREYKQKHKAFNKWIVTNSTTAIINSGIQESFEKESALTSSQQAVDGPADHPAVSGGPVYGFISNDKIRGNLPHQQRGNRPTDILVRQDLDHFINTRRGFKIVDSSNRDEYYSTSYSQ